MALFICSYMFQGLALVDLADLKWGDFRDVEVIDKEKYARDSGEFGIDYANENKEVQDYYEINVARSKTNKPVRILVEQMTVLPFLLPFTEAIKNVPMGLIAQNMGRNPAEIETYLKDFDRDSVIDASKE